MDANLGGFLGCFSFRCENVADTGFGLLSIVAGA